MIVQLYNISMYLGIKTYLLVTKMAVVSITKTIILLNKTLFLLTKTHLLITNSFLYTVCQQLAS